MLEKHHHELRTTAKALASQRQQQEYQLAQSTEITGPLVSLSSPTALRALVFQEVKSLLANGYSSRGIAKQLQIIGPPIGRNTVNKYKNFNYL